MVLCVITLRAQGYKVRLTMVFNSISPDTQYYDIVADKMMWSFWIRIKQKIAKKKNIAIVAGKMMWSFRIWHTME